MNNQGNFITQSKGIFFTAVFMCSITLLSSAMAKLVSENLLSQYPAQIRTAVIKMIVTGNTEVEQIRFNQPEELARLANQNYAVFSPEGGGAIYKSAPAEFMANNQNADFVFNMEVGIPNIGTASPDLVAYLIGISQTVCEQVNTEMALPVPAPQLRSEQSDLYMKRMVDNYQPSKKQKILLDLPEEATDPFGCFLSYDGKSYVYYHTLVEF